MSHTKEPWFIPHEDPNTIIASNKRLIATFCRRSDGCAVEGEDYENAERVMACFDVCAGLPNPEKNIKELVVLLCRALNNEHVRECKKLCCAPWREEAQALIEKIEEKK